MTFKSLPPVALVAGLFLTGVGFWGGVNWSLDMTNSESFCISCHEMKTNIYPEYIASAHFKNAAGVRATCPDCHVPREWVHMVARKIRASNELYHWLAGSIDSRDKFLAKRLVLARYVWDAMRETDSRECRNCHHFEGMALESQSKLARGSHKAGRRLGHTCIDCHLGVAHALPDDFDREADIDRRHREFEHHAIPCHECHEQLRDPKSVW